MKQTEGNEHSLSISSKYLKLQNHHLPWKQYKNKVFWVRCLNERWAIGDGLFPDTFVNYCCENSSLSLVILILLLNLIPSWIPMLYLLFPRKKVRFMHLLFHQLSYCSWPLLLASILLLVILNIFVQRREREKEREREREREREKEKRRQEERKEK